MSNGGGFSGLLACNSTANSQVAVFAMSSAAAYTNTSDVMCTNPYTVLTNTIEGNCTPGRQIPLLEVHGNADTTIPYTGGPRRSYCLPAVQHWITDW